MFSRVILNNFKSFDNITFNLCNKANNPNNLILIYGKNGSGKSNVVSSFALLKNSLITMSSIKQYEDFMRTVSSDEKYDYTRVIDRLKKDLVTTEKIIKEFRSLNAKDSEITTCEYQFIIGDVNGSYKISYNSREIVFEEMILNLNERKGVIFSFEKGKENKIKPAITSNKEFYKELIHQANMYWGKHTFLSIVQNEILNKSCDFAYNALNRNFRKTLNFFISFTCKINGVDSSQIDVMHNDSIFDHPRYGYLRNGTIEIINKCGDILSDFLNNIDDRIVKAYYKTENVNNGLTYELYLSEKQNGELIEICQSRESNGTKTVIDLLFHLLNALKGECVILDECDSSIHDLLFSNILSKMYQYIDGQLIITTHNTTLMENKILKDSIYVISSEDKTKICSIVKNSNRIYDSNNVRTKYYKGEYNGIPKPANVDYDLLTNKFKNLIHDYYKNMFND